MKKIFLTSLFLQIMFFTSLSTMANHDVLGINGRYYASDFPFEIGTQFEWDIEQWDMDGENHTYQMNDAEFPIEQLKYTITIHKELQSVELQTIFNAEFGDYYADLDLKFQNDTVIETYNGVNEFVEPLFVSTDIGFLKFTDFQNTNYPNNTHHVQNFLGRNYNHLFQYYIREVNGIEIFETKMSLTIEGYLQYNSTFNSHYEINTGVRLYSHYQQTDTDPDQEFGNETRVFVLKDYDSSTYLYSGDHLTVMQNYSPNELSIPLITTPSMTDYPTSSAISSTLDEFTSQPTTTVESSTTETPISTSSLSLNTTLVSSFLAILVILTFRPSVLSRNWTKTGR